MVLRGCTQKLLRWPVLLFVFLVLGVEFACYLLVRVAVNIFEFSSRVRFRAAKKQLREAPDFVSWCQAARELDRLEGRESWKSQDEDPHFDVALMRDHMAHLQAFREKGDWEGLMGLLKLILSTYNVAGINNHQLYSQTHFGTKLIVHDFIQLVLESCMILRDAEELPLTQRREFFRRARRWYGRTALLLSGGAAMGYFHIGVLKTLLEAKCMPQILSGASAGSLMCGFIAVRTDQEILRDLCVPESERFFRACEEPFCVKLTRWLRHGYVFDKEQWIVQMRTNITKGDTTFLEAYRSTGRIINISVTGTSKYSPSVILNYRNSPDVVIWSAVLASSAFPNFLAPIELQLKNPRTGKLEGFHVHGKSHLDGTIKNDIPIEALAKLWGANYFIVSQVNPHLVPLFFAQRGGTGRPAASLAKVPSRGSGLRGGFVLAMFEKLLKLEMGKWFKFLSDLDLLPTVFGADWRFIYLQKLTGTVTIVPDAPLWAYFRVISDPNHSAMEQYILTGERATWYKLCRISNHYRVEKTLIECSRFLEREAAKAGLPLHKERVSHLNTMPDQIVDAHRAAGSPANGSPLASPLAGPADSPRYALDHTVAAAAAATAAAGASNGSNGHSSSDGSDAERKQQRAERHSHTAAASTGSGSGPSSSSSSRKKKKSRNGGDAAAAASSSSTAASLGSDTEEVDDVLVSRDSEGEIAHTLTSQLLGSHRPSVSHAHRRSVGPLWKRGQDTDTDTNTDEELEEEEQARRRRYEPAMATSPNA